MEIHVPSFGDLIKHGFGGVLLFVGVAFVLWGAYSFRSVDASNGLVMLGFALVCWSRTLAVLNLMGSG
jgi:hypothetical protein